MTEAHEENLLNRIKKLERKLLYYTTNNQVLSNRVMELKRNEVLREQAFEQREVIMHKTIDKLMKEYI